MKTSSVPFSALSLLFVSACGMFGEPDSVLPVDSDVPAPTRPDSEPAPAPLEGTPVVDELVESFGVFVSTTAKAGGDGTRMSPFATIAEGIEAAKQNGKRVYVCEGTYREAVTIADGISMVGGLDCSSPKWTLGNARSRIESPAIPAVTATSIKKTTRFERFEVIAPDATSDSPTSIALSAKDAASLTIAKSRIVAGNGADGASGVDPQPKSVGPDADGKLGPVSRQRPSSFFAVLPEAGGQGGTSACGGPSGGTGGTGGVWRSVWNPALLKAEWVVYGDNYSVYGAYPGVPGAGKIKEGSDGSSAMSPGSFTRDGFVSTNGTRGTNGSPGRAGNGGHGHAAISTAAAENTVWFGVQGSGGGAAGCGGDAGSAGTGGGASIAAFVSDGAMTFTETELVAQNGGAGGKGTFGSPPTLGGKGGPVILGAPGTGGDDGTPGGLAGISGSGAGGSSIVIVHFGEKPKVENTKLVVGQAGSGVAAMTKGTKTIPASASGDAIDVLAK